MLWLLDSLFIAHLYLLWAIITLYPTCMVINYSNVESLFQVGWLEENNDDNEGVKSRAEISLFFTPFNYFGGPADAYTFF